MGKKYIITESQERILTKLVERELGPEESVFVTKKNPFRYEEYKDARRKYSPELRDGDRFYDFNLGLYERNMANNLKNKLVGKTIRIEDKIYTITDKSNRSWDFNKIRLGFGLGNIWDFLIDSNGNYELELNILTKNKENIEQNKLRAKQFESQIKPFIDYAQSSAKEVFKEIPIEQIDDLYFEIKQIKRKPTDF